MKNAIIKTILFITTVLIVSCKDEDDDTTPANPVTYSDYLPMKVGNYWVYQQFYIDSSGNETATGIIDSCYIESDTLVNNKTYFKLVKPFGMLDSVMIIRDSLHYIVDLNGSIQFSSQDFTTIFNTRFILANDTVCKVEKKMENQSSTSVVPAGTFTTLFSKDTYYMYPNWSFNGSIRYTGNRYAENIGVVVERLAFYVSSPNYAERRLIRYHLN